MFQSYLHSLRTGNQTRVSYHQGITDDSITALIYVSGHFSLDLTKGRVGIPKDRLSGFESFESFDPATWVRYGYSVVNVNARGILGSEGDHRYFYFFVPESLNLELCSDKSLGGTGRQRAEMVTILLSSLHLFHGQMAVFAL